MDDNDFTAECDTCGDQSDSAPGLPCGRPIGPPGHDDDHPDATPCTGTYQPRRTSPPTRPDPESWREMLATMTPAMWLRLALLCAVAVATAVVITVAIVQSFTDY